MMIPKSRPRPRPGCTDKIVLKVNSMAAIESHRRRCAGEDARRGSRTAAFYRGAIRSARRCCDQSRCSCGAPVRAVITRVDRRLTKPGRAPRSPIRGLARHPLCEDFMGRDMCTRIVSAARILARRGRRLDRARLPFRCDDRADVRLFRRACTNLIVQRLNGHDAGRCRSS